MLRARIQAAFFTWGWLLIAFFPVLQLAGRAAFTFMSAVYLLWAMFSLAGTRVEIDRRLALCYALLMVAFALGIPQAQDSTKALGEWSKYLAYSLVFWWIYATLQQIDNGVQRFIAALGVSGLLLTAALYVKLFFDIQCSDFVPAHHMREDNLPLLAPFVLYWLSQHSRKPLGRWLAVPVIAAIGYYVVLSEGRAALVGLVVALFCYAMLVLRWRAYVALLCALALLAAAVAMSGKDFLRGAQAHRSFTDIIDVATNYRSALWRQAVATPPPNPLIGVGMSNTARYESVVTVRRPDGSTARLGHLHNFILDAWYENGWIGLAALLWWLGLLLFRGVQSWRVAPSVDLGVLLAGVIAILANASLSYSYASRQFNFYMFALLAAIAFLSKLAFNPSGPTLQGSRPPSK